MSSRLRIILGAVFVLVLLSVTLLVTNQERLMVAMSSLQAEQKALESHQREQDMAANHAMHSHDDDGEPDGLSPAVVEYHHDESHSHASGHEHVHIATPEAEAAASIAAAAGAAIAAAAADKDKLPFRLPKPIPPIKNRTQIFSILQAEGMTVGAELGVQRGLFSETALTHWPACTRYILVDVWAAQENYKDIANVDNAAQNELYAETMSRVAPWKSKVEVLRMFTSQAAGKIKDGELDFVYVDARHDYCGVMEDLVAYWPKVRSGGIMAGHDYMEASEVPGQDWGVCGDGSRNEGAVMGAVLEFSQKHSLQVIVVYNE
ncbi:hypothetical protein BC831DRAFT_450950 [Entophlyctis helioformis]|nr:hypothetical protein BC831DRAFT_450950 [Entophlyctis helioformis]